MNRPERNTPLTGRLDATWSGDRASVPLAELADRLLEGQRAQWPGLAAAYAGLGEVRVREITGRGWRVKLQYNPRRIVSGGARVDPESIRRRPCFLCEKHLPAEQRAILYREAYLILCNPAPIFPGHLTIARVRHIPQAIPDRPGVFLRLARDLGPRRVVLYNGPRCGASAPDHLHFQAVPAGCLPVEAEALGAWDHGRAKRRGGAAIWRTAGLGRGIVVIEGERATDVAAAFADVVGGLRRLCFSEGEPLLNLLGLHTGERWRVLIFPRRKHRPDAYSRAGEDRLLVSPGAVDMGGVVITAVEKDFLALDQDLLRGIFAEVAFDDAAVAALLDGL